MDGMAASASQPSNDLRVLQVIESLSRGGAERRLVNDLTYLAREGVESRVVYIFPAADLRPEIEALGVSAEWLGVSRPRDLARGILRLKKLIQADRPDVIHTQLFYGDLCARLAGRWAGIAPVMATLQNSMYEPDWEPFYDQSRRLQVDRFTARRFCHHAVAVSEHVKRSSVRLLGFREEQVTVIHNSVDTARFAAPDPELRHAVRSELGVAPEEFALVSAARFVPQKGFAVMVRAMASLLREISHARLYLAGGGPDERNLRGLCRSLGLEGRVVFLGVRNDLHRLLPMADVFLFASLASEGFPLVPLEAMALGVPVVSCRIEPIGELIEDGLTGLLVPPGDAEALAQAVARLARDEGLRKTIAEAGRRRVHESFNARRSARQLAECYRMLCDRFASRS
jgi:glycosyltransferase involved in cell wall biosynthesis